MPAVGRRSVCYLHDRVLTRDVWMHRVDIARAAGASLTLTTDHDGPDLAQFSVQRLRCLMASRAAARSSGSGSAAVKVWSPAWMVMVR